MDRRGMRCLTKYDSDILCDTDFLFNYKGDDEIVEVPGYFRTINTAAFSELWDLEEVVFSEGVQYIRPGAFYRCRNLKRIYLPSSIRYVDPEYAIGCPDMEIIFTNGPESEQNLSVFRSRMEGYDKHQIRKEFYDMSRRWWIGVPIPFEFYDEDKNGTIEVTLVSVQYDNIGFAVTLDVRNHDNDTFTLEVDDLVLNNGDYIESWMMIEDEEIEDEDVTLDTVSLEVMHIGMSNGIDKVSLRFNISEFEEQIADSVTCTIDLSNRTFDTYKALRY